MNLQPGNAGEQVRQNMGNFNVVGSTATLTVLKVGSKGNAVRTWQNALNWTVKSKSPIAADGIFGTGTKAATIELQKYLSIPADGIVGPQTVKAYQARWPNYISRLDLTEQEQPGATVKPASSTSQDFAKEVLDTIVRPAQTPGIPPFMPSNTVPAYAPSYPPSYTPTPQQVNDSQSNDFLGLPILAWGALAVGAVILIKKRKG